MPFVLHLPRPAPARLCLLAVLPLLALPSAVPPGAGGAGGARGAAQGQAEPGEAFVAFAELGLTLDLGELAPVLQRRKLNSERILGSWKGDLDGCYVQVTLQALDRARNGFEEPDQVAGHAEWLRARRARPGERPFAWDSLRLVDGAYGWAAYGAVGHGVLRKGDEEVGEIFCLAGLVEAAGYTLEVESEPALPKAWRSVVAKLLESGLRYDGPVRDARWSDEEAEARWRRDAPGDLADELKEARRTDHYLILSNTRSKKFAQKMEQCYEEIREIFPFPDSPEQRLLPMFIFRTPDQYYDYCEKVAGMSREQARQTKGHAWRDYYATWYEAPGDPVHIHEATHQIFANRLYLSGGGSWFQEGVAEYVESSDNDRNVVARDVEKGRHVPLREFVQIQSLALSKSGDEERTGSRASDHYKQAALLIEFLRESKWGRDGFDEFLRAMGNVQRSDVDEIEGIFLRIWGASIEQVDEQFVAYCKKR